MSNKNSENQENKPKIEDMLRSEENHLHEVDKGGYIICHPGQIMGSYKIVSVLGEGAYGRVTQAENLVDGTTAALKIISKTKKAKRNVAMAEITALTSISRKDPNDESLCIKMLDWFECDMYLCIAFPVLGLSVFDFLKENDYEPFPMEHVRHISYQLCYAVDFLHRNGMTHTDLKPENLLFLNSSYITIYDEEKKCDVRRIHCTDIRLIDFGLLTRDEDLHRSVVSTIYYRAPEVVLKLGWSQPCDVWSIGCILVEIYSGNVLFTSSDDREHLAMMEKILGKIPLSMVNSTKTKFFLNGILDWNWDEAAEDLEEYCNLLKICQLTKTKDNVVLFELIEKMLEYEPEKRILLSSALVHPFFNKVHQ